MRRLFLILLLVGLQGAAVFGASVAETRAFKISTNLFADKLYAIAEQSLADFLAKHPESEFRSQAILFQAKSRFHQTNYTGAIELLQAEIAGAGRLGDQYHFWLAETFFQQGNFEKAAAKYGEVAANFPQSPFHTEACYDQALSFSKLRQWEKVADLLGNNDGAFQKAIQAQPANPFAAQGLLLLSEALFQQKQFAASEKVLAALGQKTVSPESRWRQEFLLCKVQLAQKKFSEALSTSSNLVSTATSLAQPGFSSETARIRGTIFEKLNQLPQAAQAYEANLSSDFPDEIRREALFKIVELTLAQQKTDDAIVLLEKFTGDRTNDSTLDLAFFTLGELRLKQFFAAKESTNAADALSSSNFLQAAFTNLSRVVTNFPNSEFLGKTFLDRGWCFWAQEKFAEAQNEFLLAVAKLPSGEDQAIARFKLADAEFKQGKFSDAAKNYQRVIADYAKIPAIKSALFDQALYQIVRASLAHGDQETARDAMSKILEWYPNTGYAERSLLLVGQDLNRKRSPEKARELFLNFVEKSPNSPLLPDVKLAIARTYSQEKNWSLALKTLEDWTSVYTNNALLPHAEFSRALSTYQAGMETNAVQLFTAFVERFSTNDLAPLAQNWLGDFYFNKEEFAQAEQHYQLVDKLNPGRDLSCQAKLGAALAAVKRDGFKDATNYFLTLINDTNTPAKFLAQSYFAFGDTVFSLFLAETNKASTETTNYFDDAINAFSKVAKDFSTNEIGVLALGRRADCLLQWALVKNDAAKFGLALTDYVSVLESPLSQISARSQAEVGIGRIFEAQGDLTSAGKHYAKVFYVNEGESFDPKWVKEAGLAAAKICETRGEWEQAMNVYRRLSAVLPSLKPTLEKKIASAQTRFDSVKK